MKKNRNNPNIGFVYFIEEIDKDHIKIGFSEKHPKQRLKDFQTGNSSQLKLIGYIEGTYEDEYKLHKKFSIERIRRTEWFESSSRLREYINKLLEEFINNQKNSIPKLTAKDISVTDNYNGFGVETYENGQIKYEGDFKNGKRHGNGTYTFSDGKIYEGEWKNGNPWNVTEYDNSGNITAKWLNGNFQ